MKFLCEGTLKRLDEIVILCSLQLWSGSLLMNVARSYFVMYEVKWPGLFVGWKFLGYKVGEVDRWVVGCMPLGRSADLPGFYIDSSQRRHYTPSGYSSLNCYTVCVTILGVALGKEPRFQFKHNEPEPDSVLIFAHCRESLSIGSVLWNMRLCQVNFKQNVFYRVCKY